MHEQLKIVKQHFGERSVTYSEMFDASVRTGTAYRFQRRSKIIGELAAARRGCMVDCATGTGEVTLSALKTHHFKEAIVNDVSPEMLSRAALLIQGSLKDSCSCHFLTGDAFSLLRPSMAEKFDLVLCIGLLAHVGRLDDLMLLCRGLVKEHGHILFQTTLLDHPGIRITKLFSERRHLRQKGYTIRHYRHSQILDSAARADLEVVERRRFGLDVPFLDKALPRLSHLLEQQFEKFCPNRGAEAIYVLRKRSKTVSATHLRLS